MLEEEPEDFFENDENLSDEDKIRLDNDLKRLKIEMNGGQFLSEMDFSNIPPEVEGKFLDNILEFEKKIKSKKETTIREKLGNPEFLELEFLTEETVKTETSHILNLFFQSGIIVSTQYDVDPFEFYNFITNEFLDKNIIDIDIEGFISHFIYEDFVPNYNEAIKEVCIDFFKNLEALDFESIKENIDEEAKIEDFWSLFIDSYESIEFQYQEFNDIEMDLPNAKVELDVEIEAKITNSSEIIRFKGKATAQLVLKSNNDWLIFDFQLPKN